MNILHHSFQQFNNISLVQFSTLKGEGLPFLPAGPAMEKENLIIEEVSHSGSVNYLRTFNRTGHYLLLTDMDILRGAKQNRVLNVSVLIKPHSKGDINVSCVERSRWDFNSPKFTPNERSMDAKARAKKLASLKEDMKSGSRKTQGEVWDHISASLTSNALHAPTENYDAFLEDQEMKAAQERERIQFEHDNACNGVAIFDGRKIVGFDLFGNRPTYAYYFSKLERQAATQVLHGEVTTAIEKAEAYYRLGEFLDTFESNLEQPDTSDPERTGTLQWSGIHSHPGFNLNYKDQPVHMAGIAN